MANTYQNQLRTDEALVDSETEHMPADVAMAERAARFSALCYRYAGYADYEAAQRQRLERDRAAHPIGEICDERR